MIEALAGFWAQHSKLVDQIGIDALLALSLSICLCAGQLALAQAAFMGIAGYVAAIAVVKGGWPLPLAALAAVITSAAVGGLLSLPVARLRGVFLAIATIGFGEIVRVVADNLDITGGAEGFTGIPPLLNTGWIYGSLAVVAGLFVLLRRSRFALMIAATREDEAAAEGAGIDTGFVRFATLSCAGAIAGIAGVLYAFTNFFIAPGDFAFGRMEQILVYCVIGGVTSPSGAVAGAALMTVLPEAFRFLRDFREVTNGLILLGVILYAPAGLGGLWKRKAAA